MSHTLEQIAALTGAQLRGRKEAQVSWLLTDSRSLCFPESTLFFALHTNRGDGSLYIPELYKRGVRSFVVSALPGEAGLCPEANYLVVPSPLKALQRLAERHREAINIPVIGVTGSNGKTIVKEWIYQLLQADMCVTRSPRSYNSQIGVPLSVWGLNEQSEIGVFEAGISQPGEMDALEPVIQPTIGVFTCLGEAHQENFTGMEQKCLEKLKLFRDAQVLVYCIDNEVVSSCVNRSLFKGQYLAWSRERTDVPLAITGVEKNEQHSRITYEYKGMSSSYVIPFVDEASVMNSITALAVCLWLGMRHDTIAKRMSRLESVAMRLEVIEGRGGNLLINDAYNSDYNSLDIALDFMHRRAETYLTPAERERGHMLLLSDIEQAGEDPAALYSRVAQLCKERGVDRVIGVGEAIMEQQACFPCGSQFFHTTHELLQSGLLDELSGQTILVKGARSFHFETIIEQLTLKVHETTLEVNLNAVVDNLNYYRSFLKPETKVVCMVKASAYGAGAVEIARTLQEHKVDYLAVAVADEGVTLRQAGITANIMIMNPEMSSFKTLFEYDLEPEVYSFRLLKALMLEAEKEGVTDFPIHIKLDTGMHRLGFNPHTDMPQLIECLQHQQALIPRSVFSHFVGSDSDGFDEFSRKQYALFLEGSEQLQAAFQHKILRHMCNSAGIEHFPQWQMEMVRLGLGLYGINSRNNEILHNVSTLKTTILQIHDVPAADTVGYSRKGHLTRDSRIAALPIGYADGLDRKLGNGAAYCLVRGQKAPYVGNICMDVCMIDVTDIDCKEGDAVTIFGDDLPVTVLSDAVGTIPYEILTGVSTRVKRVYYKD